MSNHSRFCYFGLAKSVWSSGILQGDSQEVKGTVRNGTGRPSLPLPSALSPSAPRQTGGTAFVASWHLGSIMFLKIKISAPLFFGGWGSKRTTPVSSKGLFWRREGHRSRAKVPSSGWPHTGPFFWIWSARPGKEKLHQHRKHSEKGGSCPGRSIEGLATWPRGRAAV